MNIKHLFWRAQRATFGDWNEWDGEISVALVEAGRFDLTYDSHDPDTGCRCVWKWTAEVPCAPLLHITPTGRDMIVEYLMEHFYEKLVSEAWKYYGRDLGDVEVDINITRPTWRTIRAEATIERCLV